MKIIAISRPDFFRGESEVINEMFERGLERLHLRKPFCKEAEYKRLLGKIDPKFYKRISLHEHFDLANKLGVGGVHLNRRNPDAPKGFDGRISASCRDTAEMHAMLNEYDYVFLSPVFDSISKKGYGAAYSYRELLGLALDGVIGPGVVALGGVSEDKLKMLSDLNFSGAAVLGYLWQGDAGAMLKRFDKLMAAAAELREGYVKVPTVLSIAGSDSSGGAGIQADIKTISAIGPYAMTAITAVTAQNTMGVRSVNAVRPEALEQQLAAVFEDIRPSAVKIGMTADAALLKVIAEALRKYRPRNVVFDPVMAATSGDSLLTDASAASHFRELMPMCDLITPNLGEAEKLLGRKITDREDAVRAVDELSHLAGTAALLKGGHFEGTEAEDLLCTAPGETPLAYSSPKLNTNNLHGTGCTLSSAIAAYLAIGYALTDAVRLGKAYVHKAIKLGRNIGLGNGSGPLWHNF